MQSLTNLYNVLRAAGYNNLRAQAHIAALTTHACVCRVRAESPCRPAFRKFVVVAAGMTRISREMDNLRWHEHDAPSNHVSSAACEALFDLIAEDTES